MKMGATWMTMVAPMNHRGLVPRTPHNRPMVPQPQLWRQVAVSCRCAPSQRQSVGGGTIGRTLDCHLGTAKQKSAAQDTEKKHSGCDEVSRPTIDMSEAGGT
jgi:hypothetical protein